MTVPYNATAGLMYAYLAHSEVAHNAAGPGELVACRLRIHGELTVGQELPAGRRLCLRCAAMQADLMAPPSSDAPGHGRLTPLGPA